MKILYVFRSLAVWGGIERVLVEKMNYLVSMYSYNVYMLTSDQGCHPIPYHLDERVHFEDLGIRFHQKYQYNRLKRYWIGKRLKALYEQKLSDRISSICPDVIACTTADHIDSLVRLKGAVPLVVESHSICLRTIDSGRFWLQSKWYRYHYLKAISEADVIVALTEGDAAEWRKVHSHVEVIPNMISLGHDAQSTLNNKRVIFVGRFDYQKRPLEMIRIWKSVFPKHPDWRLDIYGEGEQLKELNEISRSLHMNITIHLPTERIFDCYGESDLLVSTSLFEPFGLVILEAMSCGLPVVAYDCPYGPGDMIVEGKNGFLINDGDIDGFVEKLSLLMDSLAMRRRMGAMATSVARKYMASSIMPQWKSLFEKLLHKQ